MISILIACYNRNVLDLINNLHVQLNKSNVTFEIICIDDASKSEENIQNQKINKLPFCSFEILEKNIGRSAIRNLLASKSNYSWMLFLDADVLPVSATFISSYLREIGNNKYAVVLGGIKYRDFDGKNLLRWRFGKKSEEISASTRKKDCYKYFFTANFLINKQTFNTIKFNNNIVEYGYEDLLFSKELDKKDIKLKHLENEVFHLGIDQNEDFIDKTKKAIRNLSFLITTNLLQKEDTNLSQLYFKLKPYGVLSFLSMFSSFFEKVANQKSSVTFYNLFRITYLHQVIKNSK